jgi:hypothetical protein
MNSRFGVRKHDEGMVQALLEETGAATTSDLFSLMVNRYGQHLLDTFKYRPGIEQPPLAKPLPPPTPNQEFTPFEL